MAIRNIHSYEIDISGNDLSDGIAYLGAVSTTTIDDEQMYAYRAPETQQWYQIAGSAVEVLGAVIWAITYSDTQYLQSADMSLIGSPGDGDEPSIGYTYSLWCHRYKATRIDDPID